ncbi:hypothetical protein R5R35_000904 [Gryllus longicercus]|uniref:Transporter n=1 Tax=Gryllus longicercus TaxID=2509291 RepID=A0AAN9ZBL8_9ORTH
MSDAGSFEGADNPAFQADEPAAGHPPAKKDDGGGDAGADAGEEGADRQQWGSSLEFLMSCIAMSVGLGNVWRFPFTAYENGGGAFLIPYIIVLIVIGRPLYYLEMGIGQFANRSCIKIWNMAPALRGVGYGQIAATACVMTYYSSLMAITVLYFIYSFQKNLPWANCGDDQDLTGTSCGEIFFTGTVLKELPLDEGLGTVNWRLALCLLASWLLILGVVVRGVRSSGKAAYFLALFPYVVMLVLLVRGCTLPGADKGMLYFVEPKWGELLKPQVWHAAVTQAFFSLNVGFGSLINYASFNNFRHNIYRDAMIVTTMDTFTSLLAGCTIFAILGNLAHEMGVDEIDSVVKAGAGLAFISYPDAIAKFDAVPQLFAVLFFLMLLSLGLGSAVALVSVVVTIITDNFPQLKQFVVMIVVCVVSFGISIVYVTQGGQSILNLIDNFGATYPVLALMCVEMGAIAWLYGLDNICNDLAFMLKRKAGSYWRITWGLVTPIFLIAVLIYAAVEDEPLEYGQETYPDHYYVVGWTIMALIVALVPIFICIEVGDRWLNKKMPFIKALRTAFQPNDEWGPSNTRVREQWRSFKNELAQQSRNEGCTRAVWRKLCGCGSLDIDFEKDDDKDVKAPNP